MVPMSEKDIAEYFRRSYTAVDGLWFMKVEERRGFEDALDIDREVWKILPKIQARTLKALTHMEYGMDALFHCFTTKLSMEGYLFTTARNGDRSFTVTISRCPWHDMMVRKGRGHIAGEVGTVICRNEYAVWASEFDRTAGFEMHDFLCAGSEYCSLEFRRTEDDIAIPGVREENGEHFQGENE